jgi:pimeloyl-ACP methyl ester carboxylesterase
VRRTGVILLHGLRASSTLWRRQVELLRGLDHPVAAPDFPGHGTRRGERFTLETALTTVDDAALSLLDAGAPAVLVVGQSLGGYVGLHWAARTSLPVEGVLAAACSTEPSAATIGGYRLLAGAIGLLPDNGAWLNDHTARWALPAEGLRDLAAGGFALDVMQDTLREVRRLRPITDIRSLGEMPVWLVNGSRDHFRLQERAYLTASGNGRLVVVPGVKHLVSLEAPVLFNRVLLEMLAALERAEAAAVPAAGRAARRRRRRRPLSGGRRALAGAAASAPGG